jgi:gamma-glutamyl-gamma-aminobutyrate hydrolase PuuD
MKKIIDVGAMYGYPVAAIFNPWRPDVLIPDSYAQVEKEIEAADFLCFGGGQDIHPSLYGHMNVASNAPILSIRDRTERSIFELCVHYRKPMLGICRGSQFLCAMAGGALIQHVDGHALGGTHNIMTIDGHSIPITSTHHQMMFPNKTEHTLIAWLEKPIEQSGRLWDHKKMTMPNPFKDPEIVYFPRVKALCIQGHPEYQAVMSPAQLYTRQLVEKYLLTGPVMEAA